MLYELAERVVETLDVQGAGVSLRDDNDELRPVTVINQLTSDLEDREEADQEGPCIDAYKKGEVVVVDRLEDEARWPTWTGVALDHGVTSVLGIPLRTNDDVIGAMNIYSVRPRRWSDAEVQIAQVLADMATSYVINASALEQATRVTEQLQEALDSRIVIEQAKGILAGERQVSLEKAFAALRQHARTHGATLRSVADAVVHLGLRP